MEKGTDSLVVIDDDRDSLAYLTALFSRRGIRYEAFARAPEALEFIRTHAVSVVVTDIVMPDVDGVEILSAVKCYRPCAAVIALSGYDQLYLRSMVAFGAVAQMTKPVDPAVLLAAVEGCLNLRAPRLSFGS